LFYYYRYAIITPLLLFYAFHCRPLPDAASRYFAYYAIDYLHYFPHYDIFAIFFRLSSPSPFRFSPCYAAFFIFALMIRLSCFSLFIFLSPDFRSFAFFTCCHWYYHFIFHYHYFTITSPSLFSLIFRYYFHYYITPLLSLYYFIILSLFFHFRCHYFHYWCYFIISFIDYYCHFITPPFQIIIITLSFIIIFLRWLLLLFHADDAAISFLFTADYYYYAIFFSCFRLIIDGHYFRLYSMLSPLFSSLLCLFHYWFHYYLILLPFRYYCRLMLAFIIIAFSLFAFSLASDVLLLLYYYFRHYYYYFRYYFFIIISLRSIIIFIIIFDADIIIRCFLHYLPDIIFITIDAAFIFMPLRYLIPPYCHITMLFAISFAATWCHYLLFAALPAYADKILPSLLILILHAIFTLFSPDIIDYYLLLLFRHYLLFFDIIFFMPFHIFRLIIFHYFLRHYRFRLRFRHLILICISLWYYVIDYYYVYIFSLFPLLWYYFIFYAFRWYFRFHIISLSFSLFMLFDAFITTPFSLIIFLLFADYFLLRRYLPPPIIITHIISFRFFATLITFFFIIDIRHYLRHYFIISIRFQYFRHYYVFIISFLSMPFH